MIDLESIQARIIHADNFNVDEKKAILSCLSLAFGALNEKLHGPFICGLSGARDQMGLPERLFICPAEGLDGFAVYTKTRDYDAPGW